MLLQRNNFSDHDFFQIAVQPGKSFHLGSGKRHRVTVFLRTAVQIRHIHLYP